MSTPATPPDYAGTLSIEERREALYAALIYTDPASAPLRDRALDRLLLGVLLGSTEASPLKFGRIAEQLTAGFGVTVRDALLHQSLDRLKATGKIGETTVREKRCYHLTEIGNSELTLAAGTGAELLDRVLKRLLRNTDQTVAPGAGRVVLRRFLSECFARFGRQIARTVLGQDTKEDLVPRLDITAAFGAASATVDLTREARECLEARCKEILRSTEPDDERLRFALTQGYYFAQLLGMDEGQFSPLVEHAFSGSVFFLDTNILLVGLIPSGHSGGSEVDELFRVAKRVGVTPKVTRATLNEARRVVAYRAQELSTVVQSVPEEILRQTRDSFVLGFLAARVDQPSISVEDFLRPLDDIGKTILDRWGVELYDVVEDELLGDQDHSHLKDAFQAATLQTRRWPKSPAILRHDVAHYVLVERERKVNRKTWFLTRDRALVAGARAMLKGGAPPFCFSLAGFLQAISPYVETPAEARSLASVFSAVMTEQAFTGEPMFEMQELLVLAEMHEDVLGTAPDRIMRAFDAVRSQAERGRELTIEERAALALELRKNITSTAAAREKELASSLGRATDQVSIERDLRRVVELERDENIAAGALLRHELQCAKAQHVDQAAEVARLHEAVGRLRRAQSAAVVGGAAVAGIVLAALAPRLVALAASRWPLVAAHALIAQQGLSACAGLIAGGPAILALRRVRSRERQVALGTLVIGGVLLAVNLLPESTLGYVVNVVQVAALLALLLLPQRG